MTPEEEKLTEENAMLFERVQEAESKLYNQMLNSENVINALRECVLNTGNANLKFIELFKDIEHIVTELNKYMLYEEDCLDRKYAHSSKLVRQLLDLLWQNVHTKSINKLSIELEEQGDRLYRLGVQ